MIPVEDANLTQEQYDAVLSHIASKDQVAIHKRVLTRYAPVWEPTPPPFDVGYLYFKCIQTNGGIKAIALTALRSPLSAKQRK